MYAADNAFLTYRCLSQSSAVYCSLVVFIVVTRIYTADSQFSVLNWFFAVFFGSSCICICHVLINRSICLSIFSSPSNKEAVQLMKMMTLHKKNYRLIFQRKNFTDIIAVKQKAEPGVFRCVDAQKQVCQQRSNCFQIPCIRFTDISNQTTVDKTILCHKATHQHKVAMPARCQKTTQKNLF